MLKYEKDRIFGYIVALHEAKKIGDEFAAKDLLPLLGYRQASISAYLSILASERALTRVKRGYYSINYGRR